MDVAPEEIRTLIYEYLEKLKDGFAQMDTATTESIAKLTTEREMHKHAYESVLYQLCVAQVENTELASLKADLESQMKGNRLVVLLDGDGAIFSISRMESGRSGGFVAAKDLREAVKNYVEQTSNAAMSDAQIWVYVFLNKRGLSDTLGRAGHLQAKRKFDEFTVGFNEAAERFLMLDVGQVKEGADAKIKAHLEDAVRLPQTVKVFFGGCHDNGYVSNLRSLMTAGYMSKLVLLPSYSEVAAGIAELGLPMLEIPDLFLTRKLTANGGIAVRPASAGVTSAVPPGAAPNTASAAEFPGLGSALLSPLFAPHPQGFTAATYSSALKGRRGSDADAARQQTPNISDGEDSDNRRPPSRDEPRRLDPSKILSKQKPPPCTMFYLTPKCKHGSKCRFAHDYKLNDGHYQEMRENAKKAPCPFLNRDEPCPHGANCVYGHVCPHLPNCEFQRSQTQTCKFIGAGMHDTA